MSPELLLLLVGLGLLLASEIADAIEDLLRRAATACLFVLVVAWVYSGGYLP